MPRVVKCSLVLLRKLPSPPVKGEETRFAHTLDAGLGRWEDDLELIVLEMERTGREAKLDRTRSVGKDEYESLRVRIPKLSASGQQVVYSGEQAFKLYDTYGLPRDFIEDLARDWGVRVHWPEFDTALNEQRTRARASNTFEARSIHCRSFLEPGMTPKFSADWFRRNAAPVRCSIEPGSGKAPEALRSSTSARSSSAPATPA